MSGLRLKIFVFRSTPCTFWIPFIRPLSDFATTADTKTAGHRALTGSRVTAAMFLPSTCMIIPAKATNTACRRKAPSTGTSSSAHSLIPPIAAASRWNRNPAALNRTIGKPLYRRRSSARGGWKNSSTFCAQGKTLRPPKRSKGFPAKYERLRSKRIKSGNQRNN